MGVGSVSGIHGLHEVITSSFTSRQVRVVFVVLGAQAMRNLIARRIVPNEEGARGFVDVTALMSHVGYYSKYAVNMRQIFGNHREGW